MPARSNDGPPYTLSRVSELTGISMPTLLRYKKSHAKRIPSIGEGRRQRFPESALAVFLQIRDESRTRVSLPRPAGRLLSLTAQKRALEAREAQQEVEPRHRTPESGTKPKGAASKPVSVTPAAVGRASEPRGSRARRPSANGTAEIAARMEALEASQKRLEKEIRDLLRELESPLTATTDTGWP